MKNAFEGLTEKQKDELFDRKVMFMKAIAYQLDKWLTDIKVYVDLSTIKCVECGIEVATAIMKDDLETLVVKTFMGEKEFIIPMMANDNSKVFNNIFGFLAKLHWRY